MFGCRIAIEEPDSYLGILRREVSKDRTLIDTVPAPCTSRHKDFHLTLEPGEQLPLLVG